MSDYKNSGYGNSDYKNSDYKNSDYKNSDNKNSGYKNSGYGNSDSGNSGSGNGDAARLAEIQAVVSECRLCPRLVAWREQTAAQKRRAYRDQPYWGRPVPGWGDPQAEVLIVGLAPAAHGGNRTGRVFTGDSSGDFLFGALYRAGFANQPQSDALGDGLRPQNVYIAAVARCAPPDNKPTPGEIANCLPYLAAEMTALARLRVIVALGRIAFDHTLRVLYPDAPRQRRLAFGHGVAHRLAEHKLTLIASYHPSRQNTQTGRLTAAMFDAVWAQVNALL